jgi:hypothetical protein
MVKSEGMSIKMCSEQSSMMMMMMMMMGKNVEKIKECS